MFYIFLMKIYFFRINFFKDYNNIIFRIIINYFVFIFYFNRHTWNKTLLRVKVIKSPPLTVVNAKSYALASG